MHREPFFAGVLGCKEGRACIECQSLYFLFIHMKQREVSPALLLLPLLLSLHFSPFPSVLPPIQRQISLAPPFLNLPFASTLDGQLT